MCVAACMAADFYPRPPCGGRHPLWRRDADLRFISIHALRAEGDSTDPYLLMCARTFLSTPSVRRATSLPASYNTWGNISIHALRAEGDIVLCRAVSKFEFLSTPSVRRATIIVVRFLFRSFDFYPRPPCGGRRRTKTELSSCTEFLSTPSVRRATVHLIPQLAAVRHFYPRPPCGGRPVQRVILLSSGSIFLSTPSVRRATYACKLDIRRCYISIHALRAEGDGGKVYAFLCLNISIHALRAEGDDKQGEAGRRDPYFYPRPPCGGRREAVPESAWNVRISIHALRAEGDAPRRSHCRIQAISIHALRAEGDIRHVDADALLTDFYPRPPCGGRLPLRAYIPPLTDFYPRPPCGGRHCALQSTVSAVHISIHALRAEGDFGFWRKDKMLLHFYPRPPCGGRQQKHTKMILLLHQNIKSLLL